MIDKLAEKNKRYHDPNLSASNLKAQAKEHDKQEPSSQSHETITAGTGIQNTHPSGSRDFADTAILEAEFRDLRLKSGRDQTSEQKTRRRGQKMRYCYRRRKNSHQ